MNFEADKAIIIEKSSFLLKKGYCLNETDDLSIRYTNEYNRISISYNKFDNISNISILFFNENELFDIGWIAFIQSDLKLNPRLHLENIKQLLTYTEQNYEKIININYCIESRKKVEKYLSNQGFVL